MAQIQDSAGFADWGLGVVAGSFSGAQLMAQLSFSHHADKGRARAMLVIGAAVGLLGVALIGLANSFGLIVLGRIMDGAGFGAFVVASRRIVISGQGDKTGSRLGLLLSAGVGGFVLGAPLAIQLAKFTSDKAPFLLIALLGAMTLPFMLRISEPKQADGIAEPSVRTLVGLAKSRSIRAALYPGCAVFVVIGVFEALWARYLTDLGASENFISFTMLAFGVPLVILAPIGGAIAQRYGALKMARIAILVTAPLMMAYGWTQTLAVLAIVVFLHSVPDSLTMPGAQLAIVEAAPDNLNASAQGLLDASSGFFAMTSAVVAAPIYQAFGARTTFTLAGVVMLLLVVASAWESRGLDSRNLDLDAV